MKKTILITGWTWYIWSHAVVAFEQAGYKTVIVDNLVNSSVWVLQGIEKIIWYIPDFFEWDLRDRDFLKEIFSKYNFDGVIHFAWLKAVWESTQKPFEYFDNNIVWSLKLFEIMNEFWVKKIIFSSSATVYDSDFIDGEKSWIREINRVWNTTNPYGTTKFLLENILKDLSKFSGFQVINLRYFNPIWAHISWYLWENPVWIPNNLLPYIMRVVTGEYEYVKVFGDDYETKDGTWVRDYIDVSDLVDGHVRAYEKWNFSQEKGFFKSYNLWTWTWVSVLEMIQATQKVVWKEILYKIFPRRDGDLAKVFCNPEKAYREFWWKTQISLEESLERSFRFVRNVWWKK